jgi:hypothetical protein
MSHANARLTVRGRLLIVERTMFQTNLTWLYYSQTLLLAGKG